MKESRISALMDGELEQEEAQVLLSAVKSQSDMQQDWLLYHTIGDTLRQTRPLSSDFTARLAARLENEPTILAPRRFKPAKRPLLALSAAASLAAVSLVVWAALQLGNPSSEQMAKNSLSEFNQASTDTSANVNSYLIAHQEYSRASRQDAAYQNASFKPSQGGKQ
jgi:sigma-E factor negative regulatory protein RseA